MAKRRFVSPDAVPAQMALPTDRMARAHNRQLAERVAGRKIRRRPGRPKNAVPSPHAITHAAREALPKKAVLHLTLKLRRGLPSLRRAKAFAVIQRSFFKYASGEGFRLVQFSIQQDHFHLIAEADSKPALSRAMHKLVLSLSRRLNRFFTDALWQKIARDKIGRVFKERYHAHLLKHPQEVRNALLYVVRNAVKHDQVRATEPDHYSSARYFDGFAKARAQAPPTNLIVQATAWLLTTGWKKLGLINAWERPRS